MCFQSGKDFLSLSKGLPLTIYRQPLIDRYGILRPPNHNPTKCHHHIERPYPPAIKRMELVNERKPSFPREILWLPDLVSME